MPKALSLKKNGVKNQSQKPITQFFKNVPPEKKVASPEKQQSESGEHNQNKRKVLSPCKINTNDTSDDSVSENVPKKPKVYQNGDAIAKNSAGKDVQVFSNASKSPTKHGTGHPNEKIKDVDSENTNDVFIKHIIKQQTETNINDKENHVIAQDNCYNSESSHSKSMSPKKNSSAVLLASPDRNMKLLIESNDQEDLDFENDIFGEDFEINGLEEYEVENLDLTSIQRCEIISFKQHPNKIELRLKNGANERGTCFVEGVWLNTLLQVGDVVSVIASRDANGFFTISNSSGLLVLRPDHLISSTSVVAGVYCRRKAVLQEKWRGIDSANTAMTIGTIIHELVQKALTQNITSLKDLQKEATNIVKESIHLLYDAGLSEKEALDNMQLYIAPLAEFMQTYVEGKTNTQQNIKDKWPGKIEKVLDIEENVCCPALGLKGKIDATLEVTIHDKKGSRRESVPLELKSGRASGSAEHRGQLVLYGMMLALQHGAHPATDAHAGLLLYLKERVDLREVRCGYPERRDLIMLRNDLARHLAPGPADVDLDKLPDIEEAPRRARVSLPEPLYSERACSTCPYLTICSIHLWHTEERKVSESHPLSKLKSQALGHLSTEHIEYFLHWTSLLLIEERAQKSVMPLHALWTESVEKRSKKGVCAANLLLKSVTYADGRYTHVFSRVNINSGSERSKAKGPQEGEYSIVSIDNRPWIAAGVITAASDTEIRILLDRDLSRRLNKSTHFHIDMYESYSTTVQNLTNVGVLMEDSDRALRLRKIIIDREPAVFSEKLPRSVGRLSVRLLRRLNVQQQRAVLRAVAAETHVLLSGLPGTGKTQTISILIQLLVALGQRVLVTAHAHAAVDNVLERLPATVRVMRLGAASRVSSSVQARTEHALTSHCTTPEQLQGVYDAMEVVGVTCLGAAHAMLARSTFDVCIVDEATQVLQCTAVRALCAAARCVLVGDPHQLPPVVRSSTARRLGMEDSLFHRVASEHNTCTLRLQYRMNERLARLANNVAYDNQLQCADSDVANATMNLDVKKLPNFTPEEEWLKIACSLEPDDAAVFFDMNTPMGLNSGDKSLSNPYEACVIIALTKTLMMGGVNASDIGVIAPYREQVSLLRRCLNAHARCDAHATSDARGVPEVSTVDQFQGRDKSVIIYSGTKRVDDNIDKKVKEGEVLNDQRRLAVSVTRAKHKLVFVGSARALQRYTPLARFMNACSTKTLQLHVIEHVYDKYKHFVT